MTKTEVSSFLAGVFSGVESSRFVPRRFRPIIDQVKAKVIGAETLVTDGMPETFAPIDVIDRLLTLAEGWFPQWKTELADLKWVVDMFLATPPKAA